MNKIHVSPNDLTRWDLEDLEKEGNVALKFESYVVVKKEEKERILNDICDKIGDFSNCGKLAIALERTDGIKLVIPDSGVTILTQDEYRRMFPSEITDEERRE